MIVSKLKYVMDLCGYGSVCNGVIVFANCSLGKTIS